MIDQILLALGQLDIYMEKKKKVLEETNKQTNKLKKTAL